MCTSFFPLPVSIGDRLKSARTHRKLSQIKAAEHLGVSHRTLQNCEKGIHSPTVEFVGQAAEVFDVDVMTLFRGVTGDTKHIANDELASQGAGDPPALAPRSLPAPYSETFRLTVYTHVQASAGGGLYGWEPTGGEDAMEVDESKKLFADLLGFWPEDELRGVRVKGTSMRRKYGGIEDGQVVLYLPTRSADDVVDGARHVLTVSEGEDSRVLVKRVQLFTGGGLKLMADNPAAGVEDEVLVPDGEGGLVHALTRQPAHIQFVGRVVWPDEYADESAIRLVGQTIDQFVARGFLTAPT